MRVIGKINQYSILSGWCSDGKLCYNLIPLVDSGFDSIPQEVTGYHDLISLIKLKGLNPSNIEMNMDY